MGVSAPLVRGEKMQISDFESNIKTDIVVVTQMAAAIDGESVDMKDYRNLAFVAALGDSGDTLAAGLYIELEIEDSEDDSTFADCADALVTNSVTGNNTGTWALVNAPAEDQLAIVTEYKGSARYVRPVVSITGTHTNGCPISIVAHRWGKRTLPVS